MLTIEKTVLPSPEQWEIIIEGMRNPMNSWDKSDSFISRIGEHRLGEKDHELMCKLAAGGSVHAKYRRMIPVFATINAPRYWWAEMDTYKIGTVANSCSTMHKIHAKEFTLDDFSHEHLYAVHDDTGISWNCLESLQITIAHLNAAREAYLSSKDKDCWWQMIQLLPQSYNQKRTVMLNYEVLVNIYRWRRDHKLDCWHIFCDWIETLPYAKELICDVGKN